MPAPPGPLQGEVHVGRSSHLRAGSVQYVCLTFNLIGLQFQRPGEYVVQLRLDGLQMKRTSFTVAPPGSASTESFPAAAGEPVPPRDTR